MKNDILNTTPTIDETEQMSSKSALTTLFIAFVLALAPLVLLYLLAHAFMKPTPSADDPMYPDNISQRLQPVGGFILLPAPKGPQTGQQVYEGLCTSCHDTGANGAPKMGSNGEWAPRIAQGFDTLFKHATQDGGYNKMPQRGGNPKLTDLEIKRAIVYMTGKSGGSFPEPVDETAAAGAAAPAKK